MNYIINLHLLVLEKLGEAILKLKLFKFYYFTTFFVISSLKLLSFSVDVAFNNVKHLLQVL